MNYIYHLIFIPIIIWLAYVVYAAWFKDWAKKHYEMGFRIPGPTSLPGYILTYRVIVVLSLLCIIILYILILVRLGGD